LTRIVEPTTDQFRRNSHGTYLTLPPMPGALIEDQSADDA
jgi:hypothetical protein